MRFSAIIHPYFYPQKNLHRHCFRFPLGHLHVPEEIANNDNEKFGGVKEVYYGICASLRINKVHTKFYKLPKSGVNRPNSKQDTAIWKCHHLHWRNVWPSGRCTHVGRQNSNASPLVWQNNKELALHGNRNDSGVLSINNLCLLNDGAKIDSGSRYWGLSAEKFSLKTKQFFLLT